MGNATSCVPCGLPGRSRAEKANTRLRQRHRSSVPSVTVTRHAATIVEGRVRLGNDEITPSELGDTRIIFRLDMPPFPALSLRAGVQGVQVVQHVRMGTPESDHAGNASKVSAFVLHPVVTAGAVAISSRVVDGMTLCTDDITLNFSPRVGVSQRVALLLNEIDPPLDRAARAYRFEVSFVPPNPSDTSVATIVTRVKDVVAGDYLVRVQVDGAESLLKTGPDPNHPAYSEPKVTIS